MEEYTLRDLHYEDGVLKVAPGDSFENLEATIKEFNRYFSNNSKIHNFFKMEVEPIAAYKDNDLNQGVGGPRRIHIIGKLKNIKKFDGLFARLGIGAPDENPLIPALQFLYKQDNGHVKYIKGQPIGMEVESDMWAYDFTERYGGMVEGIKIRTKEGIDSLILIPAINEALLSNEKLTLPYYKK